LKDRWLAACAVAVLAVGPSMGLGGDDGAMEAKTAGATVDGIIGALYDTVSFGPGGEPDWDRLRSLFLKGAVLAQTVRGSQDVVLLTVDRFITRFKDDLVTHDLKKTGFWERVAGVSCSNFGRIAHCRVVFEMRIEKDSPQPLGRGIDDIELVKTGDRWWIASVATEHELPNRPIPARLVNRDGATQTSGGPLANCSKLDFNPSELDEHGLVGPVGGKVALSYEFCVPRDERVVNEVRSIDPSVAIQAGSPGRVGCGPTEVLCVGSTNQTDHLGVLARLCELEYVSRIERAHFE